MEILQKPISENHKSAMFFDGLIAEGDGFELKTYQDGELIFMNRQHTGAEICELGLKELINDVDIEEETNVDILVDKFISIYEKDNNYPLDDYMFDNYDEAIKGFEEFLYFKTVGE